MIMLSRRLVAFWFFVYQQVVMKAMAIRWGKYRLLPREPLRRRKMYVFFTCLFLSTVFWLATKLSQEGQGSFSQPVAVVEVPEGNFLSYQSHSFIRYTVQTTGMRLLTSRYFIPTDTFTINASGLPRMTREGQTMHYLTYSSIAFRIANQLRTEVELVNVWPDTLFIQMVPAMEKKVNVQLNADFGFAQRFHQYGPVVVEPDSITITGPASLVDTLSAISTHYVAVEDLNATRRFEVALRRPQGLRTAELSQEKITVEVPVEEFTESSTTVPLEVRCPEQGQDAADTNLVLYPPEVTITYLIALRDFQRADTTAFSAYVNCPPPDDRPERLEVQVDRFPPFVIFQNVRPRSVEYLILQ